MQGKVCSSVPCCSADVLGRGRFSEVSDSVPSTGSPSNVPLGYSDPNHYLNPPEAAAYLGFDPVKGVKTILRWARSGYLPGIPLGRGKRHEWRFRKSDLDDWMMKQQSEHCHPSTETMPNA